MDPLGLRNGVIKRELNFEYVVIEEELGNVVHEGFEKMLGPYMRLHIANIPYTYRVHDIIDLFKPYGPVFAVEITFTERGKNGFGFLTMYKSDACMAFEAFRNN